MNNKLKLRPLFKITPINGFKITLLIIGSLFYLWSLPAIYFLHFMPTCVWIKFIIVFIIAIGVPAILLFYKFNRNSFIAIYTFFLIVIILFNLKTPRNDRDWRESVAILPEVEFKDSGLIIVKNIRNFKYKNVDDFKIEYYNKIYNVNEVDTLNLFLSYWDGNKKIAHAIYSFGFKNGDHLAISSEIRMTNGVEQSLLGGMFNEYEILYILADERDVVKLRTNYRKEEVYLYKIKPKGGIKAIKNFFIYVMNKVNAFEDKPEFYNTFTTNCLTSLLHDFEHSANRKLPLDYRLILNGYFDEMLYERGIVETYGLTFPEFKKVSHINQYVENDTTNFSWKIRQRPSKRDNDVKK